MSYQARAFKVFIASPGDVAREREVIRAVIERWNSIDSQQNKIVLIPIGWETNAAPEMGRAAQDYINMDILDSCDVVIGVFWTRVGTPTRTHASGSIEEILRSSANRRLTMLYFSKKAVPHDLIDPEQYSSLQKFKEEVKSNSYYCEFNDEQSLADMLYQHIHIKVNEGKFRPNWTSDYIASIQDDTKMAQEIRNSFPQAVVNALKLILCEEHSEDVWDAIVEKLTQSPPRLSEALLYIARMSACGSPVFQIGCPKLAEVSQPEFCTFLNNLYSISRFEFNKLYRSNLLTDKAYRERLSEIIQRDKC